MTVNLYKKKINILFFELRGDSLLRFPLWLSTSLLNISKNINLSFLVDEKISQSVKVCFDTSQCQFYEISNKFSVEAIKSELIKIKPNIIIIFAHRIPDLAILIAAKELNIKTIYFQHGLYIPFMKRNISLFFKNIFKTFKYFFYAISLGSHYKIGKFTSLLSFIKIYILGKNINSTKLPKSLMTADVCLVYGSYWKDYHINNYGYKKHAIKIVGTPDLDDVDLENEPNIETRLKNKTFCYVAQTLVEDGRLTRSSMKIFVKNLSKHINQINGELLIKLHPRSDKSLFSDLDCKFKYCNKFPVADIYLGHYSTMIIRGIAHSEKFILINFPGHEIPIYISMLASKIIEYNDEIAFKDAFHSLSQEATDINKIFIKREKLKNYFDVSDKRSFDRAAEAMLDQIIER